MFPSTTERRWIAALAALVALAACDDRRVVPTGNPTPRTDAAMVASGDAGAPGDAGGSSAEDAAAPDAKIRDATPAFDAAAPGDGDLASDDAAPAADAALPDASGPTADDCLEGWRNYPTGACPAPVIDRSYVAEGCVGTTGWFIEGANFQLEQHNVGIADYGPQSMGVNGNQRHWNIIRTDLLCVTIAASFRSTWVGAEIYVVNPDGQRSNPTVVQDYWPNGPPPRPSDAGVGVDR